MSYRNDRNSLGDRHDEPAFPTESEGQIASATYRFEGMTLRDWFASKLMNDAFELADQTQYEKIAARCYLKADAMMKARAA